MAEKTYHVTTDGSSISFFDSITSAITCQSTSLHQQSTTHMVKSIDMTNSDDQLLAMLLASPFIYYTVLWFFPKIWVGVCGDKNPSEQMSHVAHFLKLVQFYVMYTVCDGHYLAPSQWIEELGQVTVICCVFLFVVGQYLNYSVYSALGTNGVYYGVRFGITIPWCTEFPYNVTWLKHPQYIGSILSIIAAIPILQVPLTWGLYAVACYMYMMIVESNELTAHANWSGNNKKKYERNTTIIENPESSDESSDNEDEEEEEDDEDDYNQKLLEKKIEQRRASPKKKRRPSVSKKVKAVKKKQVRGKPKRRAPVVQEIDSSESESEEEEEEIVKKASPKRSARAKSKGRQSKSTPKVSSLEERIQKRRASSEKKKKKSPKKKSPKKKSPKKASPKRSTRAKSKGRQSRKSTPKETKKLSLEERIQLRMSNGK